MYKIQVIIVLGMFQFFISDAMEYSGQFYTEETSRMIDVCDDKILTANKTINIWEEAYRNFCKTKEIITRDKNDACTNGYIFCSNDEKNHICKSNVYIRAIKCSKEKHVISADSTNKFCDHDIETQKCENFIKNNETARNIVIKDNNISLFSGKSIVLWDTREEEKKLITIASGDDYGSDALCLYDNTVISADMEKISLYDIRKPKKLVRNIYEGAKSLAVLPYKKLLLSGGSKGISVHTLDKISNSLNLSNFYTAKIVLLNSNHFVSLGPTLILWNFINNFSELNKKEILKLSKKAKDIAIFKNEVIVSDELSNKIKIYELKEYSNL